MARSQIGTEDFAQGMQDPPSLLSICNLPGSSGRHVEDDQPGSLAVEVNDMQRANSSMSQSHTLTPSRGGTLKKRQSLGRKNSLKRSGSKKGSRPSSVRGLNLAVDVNGHDSELHSAFFTPVPTTGSPTDILANRFQGVPPRYRRTMPNKEGRS